MQFSKSIFISIGYLPILIYVKIAFPALMTQIIPIFLTLTSLYLIETSCIPCIPRNSFCKPPPIQIYQSPIKTPFYPIQIALEHISTLIFSIKKNKPFNIGLQLPYLPIHHPMPYKLYCTCIHQPCNVHS